MESRRELAGWIAAIMCSLVNGAVRGEMAHAVAKQRLGSRPGGPGPRVRTLVPGFAHRFRVKNRLCAIHDGDLSELQRS